MATSRRSQSTQIYPEEPITAKPTIPFWGWDGRYMKNQNQNQNGSGSLCDAQHNKSQNHILASGDRKQVIIRGLDLSTGQAKIYGEEYLGNVNSLKPINGQQALAYAIFNVKIVDIDAGYVI